MAPQTAAREVQLWTEAQWGSNTHLPPNLLPICSSKKAGATAKGKVGGRWK